MPDKQKLRCKLKNSFKNYVRHQKYIDKYRNDILYNSDYFVVEIVESEVYSLVNHAINLLPSDCANILKLYIDGWDIKDISTFLNKSQRVVYNCKNEAIRILKEKMSCDKLLIFMTIFPF